MYLWTMKLPVNCGSHPDLGPDSGAVANLELGERSEVPYPSPLIPSLHFHYPPFPFPLLFSPTLPPLYPFLALPFRPSYPAFL